MTSVLIVDDEPLLREELQESLELEDYEVSISGSVREALEQCHHTRFDVVVTDLKMPEQGGLVLIKKLGESGFSGKIIVVSGHGAESSREEATASGACACFAKPLDIDELISEIER
ncbi:response regulator [Epibacterium sp. SM1969]|uniref:Response regulator n=1 Tax=Tritonibacter aquimaris TaxID=2663379 RepID=A0A844ATS6_9RHOB|nr:response regulator [Tritonibacter aquimaris]MQY42758.1 response regulator [Tritonibacter aquimaris]